MNYKYRMHDPRIGRFFAVDPLAAQYPHYSSYAFSENCVINAVELEGLEKRYVYNVYYKNDIKIRKLSHIELDKSLGNYQKEFRYFDKDGNIDKTKVQEIEDYERDPKLGFYDNLSKSNWDDGNYFESALWSLKGKEDALNKPEGYKDGLALMGATVGLILSGGTLAMTEGVFATTAGAFGLMFSVDEFTKST